MQPKPKAPSSKELVGKLALIGITWLNHKGKFIEQKQYAGRVVSVGNVVRFKLLSGHYYALPPDGRAFVPAKPGIYTLRSTGEKIENPDFFSTWTVREPAPKRKTDRKEKPSTSAVRRKRARSKL